jgi:hypothetical protein
MPKLEWARFVNVSTRLVFGVVLRDFVGAGRALVFCGIWTCGYVAIVLLI